MNDLGGNPEPLKLLSSLKTLISSLMNSDNSFATEVAQMYRTTNVKVQCTDAALLQMMGLLEIELSARAQEDDEERRRKGHAHHLSSSAAEAGAVGKGKGKSKGKSPEKDKGKEKGKNEGSKGAKGKGGKDDSRPICSDYMTENGCPRGDQCTQRHPARVGKCLRCGATGHQLSTCRRPRRDAQPKAAAKPSASAKPRARSKSKAKPKAGARKGANAAWAEGEDLESTVQIEEVDDSALSAEGIFTACSFFTSFLPTFHNASSATSANSADSLELAPILDSGATHCLLPLTWLSDEDADMAKRIHLRVASGAQVRALLFNNAIYAKSVTRPLVSIGQLKAMLDLRFVWDDGPPILLLCSSGRRYVLLHAKVVHHLPLITTAELSVLLSAIHACTTEGSIWDRKKWSEQTGQELEPYGDPKGVTYPLTNHQHDQDDHDEGEDETEGWKVEGSICQAIEVNEPENSSPIHLSQPEAYQVSDQDAATEPEEPIPIQAMHIEMQVEEARKVLEDHPLPRARQRTNVRSDDYIPQGRLFGAYTTRGEGITQATFRFPLAVAAIMCLAATRGPTHSDEGFLSAQLNRSTFLPIHQDKNNHGETWLTGMGNYTGGRVWIESPLGLYPPPNSTEPWHMNLRGEYHDIRHKWIRFNPQCYHAVEQVTSGSRVSLALFSPRSWRRIPIHALNELQDVGFYPPRSAGHIEARPAEVGDPEIPGEALGDELFELSLPTPEEEAILQEWCTLQEVSLPYIPLNSSNGEVKPLSSEEMEELKQHIASGHLTKSHLCKGCLVAEGPRRVHRTVRDVDRATHVLHIDIASPLSSSDDGYIYFLVGALRLPGYPLLIDVRLLQTRTSSEVCHQLDVMVSYFESLTSEGFPLTDAPRIRRLHSDRAGEFTAPFFEKFLAHRRGIYHTLTTGYDPQANGTAERAVGLLKALSARCLSSSNLGKDYWSYAVRYAAQSLLCAALQKKQRSPPFGSQVIAQALGHDKIKYPSERSVSGRLMFWDHLSDQGSFILCPPESDQDEALVIKAGLPVLSPPDGPILSPDPAEDLPKDSKEKERFDKELKEDPAEPIELDFASFEACEEDGEESPFTFLYLSSEDCVEGGCPVEAQELPEETNRKQATTHINVTSDEVYKSTGETRKKWLSSAETEVGNLTNPRSTEHKTGALSTLNPEQKEKLKSEARSKGYQYIELPAKVVWTVKPDKFKCRIVACGNQTQDVYGRTSTTDLDAAMFRFILSWTASSYDHSLASLDITAAFLNAELPPGRIVVLRPPTILYRLNVLPPRFCWRVHRAIYGLREAPNLWSEERTAAMKKVRFHAQGEPIRIIVSEVHKSLCLLVEESDIISSPILSPFGLNKRVEPSKILAMIGIYVDDYLAAGPSPVVKEIPKFLRKLWNTSEPVFLSAKTDLPFLGITIQQLPQGIFLHQYNYTDSLLEEYGSSIPSRSRWTTGDSEHFQKETPQPPDQNNPEHLEWIKRGQRILGAFLWLSTRTRPDLACAVSLASQVLFKDLSALKARLRHLLQYLKTTGTRGLMYLYPQGSSSRTGLTEFTIYSDSSFAPAGRESQTGISIHLTYGSVRHMIHWQSFKETKMAESSAEAELYALSSAHKVGRNFRLLVCESLAEDILLNLRCDNQATRAMLDNPSWRTRYLSIYGESIRQELQNQTVILTYVSTDKQLADALTKPTPAPVNARLYPLWGLVPYVGRN